MRRRHLVGLIVASSAVACAALAQSATVRRPRVVWLGASRASSADPREIESFRKGLFDNGLLDGETVEVSELWADGGVERLKTLCAEIVRSDADVVVTAGAQPVRTLLAAGATQPIVVAVVNDAVGAGLVKNLAHPEGVVTGFSISDVDLEAGRISRLKELVPALKRVLVLHDPSMAIEGMQAAREAAATLGIEALVVEAGDPGAFGSIFAAAAADRADGASTLASAFFDRHRAALLALADRYRLPAIWASSSWVREGGLAAWSPSLPDLYRRAAGYVARLLQGAAPAELPVEPPTAFELFLNRRTADRLGLTIPPALLADAEVVVE